MSARVGAFLRSGLIVIACAAVSAACSPPAECTTFLEARDQDNRTIDALAPYGDAVDAKQSADTARAYRDAATKLKANATRIDALSPGDHTIARFAKTYTASSKQITASLDEFAARYEKLGFAQEKFVNANDRVAATRAKMATACRVTPAPTGCDGIKPLLTQPIVDEGVRKQIIRDLDTVKLDPSLVGTRTEIISALKEMDIARKELDALGLVAKPVLATTPLTQAGRDIEQQCGRK